MRREATPIEQLDNVGVRLSQNGSGDAEDEDHDDDDRQSDPLLL